MFLKTLYNFHHPHDGSGDWKGLRRRGEGEPGQLWQLWWLPPNPWLPIILSAGWDKLQGRLATQIFHFSRLTAHKRYFRDAKYHIITFRDRTASIFEFIIMHADFL